MWLALEYFIVFAEKQCSGVNKIIVKRVGKGAFQMLSKISTFFGILVVLCIIVFGFVFFEPFFTEKVIDITVVSKAKWTGEKGRYFIFTDKEVLLNENNYYHNNKTNADDLYTIFKEGSSYKVKVVGLYIPFVPRFRNILTVLEKKGTNFPLNEK